MDMPAAGTTTGKNATDIAEKAIASEKIVFRTTTVGEESAIAANAKPTATIEVIFDSDAFNGTSRS